MIYKRKNDWFIGHIQEYPDYESQGRSLDELRDNLVEIHNDIDQGLVPDAEPFQLMEVAV
jgi:predicted RNase H-like HicB family nuclease